MPLVQSTRASTPAPGHLIFIMRVVCQQRGGREEAESSGALLMGKVLYCHLLLALMHCSHVLDRGRSGEGKKRKMKAVSHHIGK